jgi:hypothetical protein
MNFHTEAAAEPTEDGGYDLEQARQFLELLDPDAEDFVF